MAAPTINLHVRQAAVTQPYQPVTVSLGMARAHNTSAADWTESSVSGEYYYNGDLSALATAGLFNVRARIGGCKSRPGTVGSLPTYGVGVGDNDSLGADTLYVRLADGEAPANNEVHITWDETDLGGGILAGCLIQWWFDQSDPTTAAMVEAWDADYRFVTDPRTGQTIDLAGTDPDDGSGYASPLRGICQTLCLPTGAGVLKVRLTNEAGESATAATTITVAEDTRTLVEVKAEGGDYTTLADAVAAAKSATNANYWHITVEDGHTETWPAVWEFLQETGLTIEFLGDAEITCSTGWLSCRGDHMLIKGKPSNPVRLVPTGTIGDAAIQMRTADSLAIIGIDFGGDGDGNRFNNGAHAFNFNNQNRHGLLVQSCRLNRVTSYPIGAATTNNFPVLDTVGYGNDFRGLDGNPSHSESAIRDAAYWSSWTMGYNWLTELQKDGARQTAMDSAYWYNNRFTNGTMLIGKAGDNKHKPLNVRMEGNLHELDQTTNGLPCLAISDVAQDCRIVSARFIVNHEGTGTALTSGTLDSEEDEIYSGYWGHYNVKVLHGTFVLGPDGGTSRVLASGSNKPDFTSDCGFENCLFIAADEEYAGDFYDAALWDDDGPQTLIGTLDANGLPAERATRTASEGCHVDYDGRLVAVGAEVYAGSVAFEASEPPEPTGTLAVTIGGGPVVAASTVDTGVVALGAIDAGVAITLTNTDDEHPLTVSGVTLGTGLTLAEPFEGVTLGPGQSVAVVALRDSEEEDDFEASVSVAHNGDGSPFGFAVGWVVEELAPIVTARINGYTLVAGQEIFIGTYTANGPRSFVATFEVDPAGGPAVFGSASKSGPWITLDEEGDTVSDQTIQPGGSGVIPFTLETSLEDFPTDFDRQAVLTLNEDTLGTLQYGIAYTVRLARASTGAGIRGTRGVRGVRGVR